MVYIQLQIYYPAVRQTFYKLKTHYINMEIMNWNTFNFNFTSNFKYI